MSTTEKNLYYLEELSDYKVASDDPDIRGWEIKDKDNRVVGKVSNMLVNKNIKRVVYLDVALDESILETNYKPYGTSSSEGIHGFLNKEGENHLIIPIGMVRLDEENKIVVTDEIDHKTFAETKRKKKIDPISREYEVIILETYTRSNLMRNFPQEEDFYQQQEFKRK
ncbi:YlmC/YmxH family sporulation protein [Aquimarina sp. M1]